MKYIIILLFAIGCSEEVSECEAQEAQCRSLLTQMDQATNAVDKENIRQHYLAEKHNLESCYKLHGK